MCLPAIGALLTGAAGGTAAAAGGLSLGSLLQIGGLALSIGGSIAQGNAQAKAYRQQAQAISDQRATEARLTAVEDERTRLKFRTAMRQQTAELAARGIDIGSPTAVLLGQTAAQEMSFASQEVRSRGVARDAELSSTQKIALSRAQSSWLEGTTSAAGKFLSAAPDLWPELMK